MKNYQQDFGSVITSRTSFIDEIMSRAGNDFLILRADIDTAGGERVVTARAQLVVRGS